MEPISAQAQNLQEMVSRFNINAEGQSPFYTPSAHPAQKQPTSIASIEHKPLVPRSDHRQKESFKSFPPQKDASPQYESDDEFGHF